MTDSTSTWDGGAHSRRMTELAASIRSDAPPTTDRPALPQRKPTSPAHLAQARYLGADAALSSNTWIKMGESDARSILSDIDAEVMDRFAEPNLSGQWEDDLSYNTLILEVTGAGELREVSSDDQDAIATAWEEGRDEVWSDALQATALRVLGDVERACEVEKATEAYVSSLRTAAGL